jgi:L-ascorbate metabolism protein UlaG (beta-lactamase superfamily)
MMITPFQSHDELLADIQSARQRDQELHLWWLGQSGFLMQWQRSHLLLDPYLSDSLTKKYAATDKPHVRMTELVIAPRRLTFVDIITSSHNHTDHLDAETLGALLDVNPIARIVVGAANQTFAAERLGLLPERLDVLDDGHSLNVKVPGSQTEFAIHAIPAAHEEIERDEHGRCRFLGYVVEFGGMAIYHSGDTLRYDGMVERLRDWKIDVALLPINGRFPERRVAGNLSGAEAAQLAKDIQAKVVIPCHYEMFEFNTASPVEFIATCRRLGQPYQILRAGERFSYKR